MIIKTRSIYEWADGRRADGRGANGGRANGERLIDASFRYVEPEGEVDSVDILTEETPRERAADDEKTRVDEENPWKEKLEVLSQAMRWWDLADEMNWRCYGSRNLLRDEDFTQITKVIRDKNEILILWKSHF